MRLYYPEDSMAADSGLLAGFTSIKSIYNHSLTNEKELEKMAAITPDGRQELVALYLTMFGRAPTTLELAQMVVARENGSTLFQVAATLALEDDFALVASKDAQSFAEYLANALLAADIPASAREWATNWVVTNVQGSKSKAQVIAEAVQAIRATTNPNYASSQAELTSDVEDTLAVIDNPIPGELSFALTADTDDEFNGGIGNDTITGLLSNLQTGDVIKAGAGDDTFNVTGDGASGVAEVDSANFNVRLIANSTIDATLFTNVEEIGIASNSITGTTLTVDNAGFATKYSIEAAGKNTGLTVDFLDSSGTADTAQLALLGTGMKVGVVVTDTAVDISDGATVEAVTIETTGTNYVDLTGGTGTKNAGLATITITGDGTNYLDIISSATSTSIDASAATGLLDLDMGTGLSDGDVLKAGAGTTDKLTATVSSTASNSPTISGFETLALTLSVAVNMDLENVTDATTLTLGNSSADQRLSNVAASITSISIQESNTTDLNNVRVDYVDDADATLALNFAPTATATAAVEYGDVQVSNVKDLTLSATGAFASTIGTVDSDENLESLTVKTSSATGDLTTDVITADELVNLAVVAAAGSIQIDGVDVDGGEFAMETISIDASDDADVNIDGTITTDETGESESNLESISIKGGDESIITTDAAFIVAADDADDTGSDVAITIELGDDSATSSIGSIDVVGVDSLNISLAENAGNSSVALITAVTGDVGDTEVTVADDAELDFTGVTATAGDIGDLTFTVTGSGKVDGATVTATAGDIGNVTTSSGDDGVIELSLVAAAGSVGDVSITSQGSDVVSINAGDSLGDVTASVTTGDLLTLTIDGDTTLDAGNITITGAGDLEVNTVTIASTGNITITSTATAALDIDLSGVVSAGTVSVTGGSGNDVVVGTATADTIVGGGGDDTITGGTGADKMTGGTGLDTFAIADDATGNVTAAATWTDTDEGSTVSTTTFDIITVVAADNDVVDVDAALTAHNTVTTEITDGTTVIAQDDDVTTYTGTYDADTGLFTSTAIADATDLLVVYDSDGAGDFEAVVLVGVTALTATLATGVLTV
jgi:hypothetical protein